MELLSTLSQQAILGAAQQPPVQKPPETRPAPSADTAAQSGTDARTPSQNGANAALVRQATQGEKFISHAEKLDRPAGPPPTFEISLLEQDREVQRSIASMEIQRGFAKDADAVAPRPQAEATQAQTREAAELRKDQETELRPTPRTVALADTGRASASPLDIT